MPMNSARRELIIEVGPGEVPAWGKSNLVRERIESGEAMYVGIDLMTAVNTDHGYFCYGRLEALPISNGVADQLWVWNVFGSGHSAGLANELGFYRTKKQDGGVVLPPCGEKYFFELARVTKEGGIIIIAEDNTPLSWLAGVDYKDFGLEKKVIDSGVFVKRYKLNPFFKYFIGTASGPPVFLELTKLPSDKKLGS